MEKINLGTNCGIVSRAIPPQSGVGLLEWVVPDQVLALYSSFGNTGVHSSLNSGRTEG
jgi:hypothetical protein